MIDQPNLFRIFIGWTVFYPDENGFYRRNTNRPLKISYLFEFAFSIPNLTHFLEFCTFRLLLPIFSLSLLSNLSLSYSDSLKQIYSPILISCFFLRAYSNYSTAWIIICSKSFSNFPSIPLCPQRSYVQSLSKSTSANMSHHWSVSACG